MTRAMLLTILMAGANAAVLVWHQKSNWRRHPPPDPEARRQRYAMGWEVRGLVLSVTVPCAAGMYFGYLSADYLLAVLLFQAAGWLAADIIAPSGLHLRR